jgi:hypothetical protein
MQASAAEFGIFFDQRHFESQLTAFDSGNIAPWTAPNNRNIV